MGSPGKVTSPDLPTNNAGEFETLTLLGGDVIMKADCGGAS